MDFETIFPAKDCKLLRDAYDAITACELWDWLKTYKPDEGRGFMFSEHPNLDKINAAMKYQGHSGFSYAWTMCVMRAIAESGWENYKKTLTRHDVCPCRAEQGYTTGWCGVAGGGVPACDH